MSEQFFSEEHLANRLKLCVPKHLKTTIQSYRSKHHHAFLYCYLQSLLVLQELAAFVAQHEAIEAPMLKKYNYYYLGDTDVEPSDDLYLIMKILSYEFLQLQLTSEYMHEFAYNEMQHYVYESI